MAKPSKGIANHQKLATKGLILQAIGMFLDRVRKLTAFNDPMIAFVKRLLTVSG